MELSRYEQETIINYNEAEKTATVYTHNKALRRKLERLERERQNECRLENTRQGSSKVQYIIPKAWVRITPSRIMTEAQYAALSRARAKKEQK